MKKMISVVEKGLVGQWSRRR